VHPSLWGQGLAKRLLQHVFSAFTAADIQHVDLFTFPGSLKHHHLYRGFGCQPALLTYLMERKLQPEQQQARGPQRSGSAGAGTHPVGQQQQQQQQEQEQQQQQQQQELELEQQQQQQEQELELEQQQAELPEDRFSCERYAALSAAEQQAALQGCRAVAAVVAAGLDCSREVAAVAEHLLGDTLLVRGGAAGEVAAFAVLHHGERTEAAKGVRGRPALAAPPLLYAAPRRARSMAWPPAAGRVHLPRGVCSGSAARGGVWRGAGRWPGLVTAARRWRWRSLPALPG
jgi:hypothetical protein